MSSRARRHPTCHPEERSDEGSAFLASVAKSRSLASLGMTKAFARDDTTSRADVTATSRSWTPLDASGLGLDCIASRAELQSLLALNTHSTAVYGPCVSNVSLSLPW